MTPCAKLRTNEPRGLRRRTTAFHNGRMPVSVSAQVVSPRKLAAVRRALAPSAVATTWGPALDKVWGFIRSQPGLRTDGHNVFLYHHPTQPGDLLICEFGVEVTRRFESVSEVYATETPAG